MNSRQRVVLFTPLYFKIRKSNRIRHDVTADTTSDHENINRPGYLAPHVAGCSETNKRIELRGIAENTTSAITFADFENARLRTFGLKRRKVPMCLTRKVPMCLTEIHPESPKPNRNSAHESPNRRPQSTLCIVWIPNTTRMPIYETVG